MERTADDIILAVLAFEFGPADEAAAERRIKRRLRYHGLGPHRPERTALLRRLTAAILAETALARRSRYFVGPHGPTAAPTDFDVPRMVHAFAAAFPDVSEAAIASYLPFAIYQHYLR